MLKENIRVQRFSDLLKLTNHIIAIVTKMFISCLLEGIDRTWKIGEELVEWISNVFRCASLDVHGCPDFVLFSLRRFLTHSPDVNAKN